MDQELLFPQKIAAPDRTRSQSMARLLIVLLKYCFKIIRWQISRSSRLNLAHMGSIRGSHNTNTILREVASYGWVEIFKQLHMSQNKTKQKKNVKRYTALYIVRNVIFQI